MKRHAYSPLLMTILSVVLLASLGLNVYQLYNQQDLQIPDDDVLYSDARSSDFRQQLSRCYQESVRKDSLISALEHTLPTQSSGLSVSR